jgi:hypothetical protein
MQPILLLHGAIGAKDQLFPLADELAFDHKVHLFNFAGHGGEKMPGKIFLFPYLLNRYWITWMPGRLIGLVCLDIVWMAMWSFILPAITPGVLPGSSHLPQNFTGMKPYQPGSKDA